MDSDLPTARIDRASPVPFYFQLAELLEQVIAGGRWEPGARLPSEPDLCARFGLSRTTVRQALARLEQRSLIERLKGHGTFVRQGRPGLWLLQSSDGFFQDEVDRLGRTVTSQVLRAERGVLPPWACHELELRPGSHGATLERLRSVDGLVALYVVNHVADRVADAALAIANPNESLYRRLRERAGIVPYGPEDARGDRRGAANRRAARAGAGCAGRLHRVGRVGRGPSTVRLLPRLAPDRPHPDRHPSLRSRCGGEPAARRAR